MIPAIAVHGGAGPRLSDDVPKELREAALHAARVGHRLLIEGGSSADAVTEAVVELENCPLFNAGFGSTLNESGAVEMDASFMLDSLEAGAVAAVQGVRNPVLLAREVVRRTPHLFIAGPPARKLAEQWGLCICTPEEMIAPRAKARWERSAPDRSSGGTVGAVAIDVHGRLAAATSTGGTARKLSGRVGDSPIIGAGTYARRGAGAISATGHGESIIKVVLAKFVSDRLSAGRTAADAVAEGIAELASIGGTGGLIAIDARGTVGIAFNTERMTRAWIAGAEEHTAYE